MGKFIYDALDIIFGGSIVDSMSSWMEGLFNSVLNLVNGSLVSTIMNVFAAIACSMLILYFFMDLVDQAKRDMFTLEKLIVSFIKFLAAFVVLLCLKDILTWIVQIGNYLYLMIADPDSAIRTAITAGSSDGIEFFSDIPLEDSGRSAVTQFPAWTDAVQTAFEDEFDGITKIFKNISLLIISVIAGLLGMVAKIAGYFICTSNAVMIIVRIVFAPIAVVQLFEDGSRSPGMKYLKGLIADCITMAVIIVILLAASALTSGMLTTLSDVTAITFGNVKNVVSFSNIVIIIVPQLVAIGAMASGGKVAHDVMGA